MGSRAGFIQAGHAAGFEQPWPRSKQRATFMRCAESGSMLRSLEAVSAARRAARANATTSVSASPVEIFFIGVPMRGPPPSAARGREMAARLERLAHRHEAVAPEQPLELAGDRVEIEIGDERRRRA